MMGNTNESKPMNNSGYDPKPINTMSTGYDPSSVNTGVRCDSCGKTGFSGARFKCNICPDFDYCEHCYKNNYKNHSHSFTQIGY